MVRGISTVLDLDDLGEAWVVLLLLVGGVGDRRWHGMVFLSRDDQQLAPLRVTVSTFASAHGLRLAVAAWNSGLPAVGTA
jgi:hypothetical protein